MKTIVEVRRPGLTGVRPPAGHYTLLWNNIARVRIRLLTIILIMLPAAWPSLAFAQDPSEAIYDESAVKTFYLDFVNYPADWDAICNDGAGSGDIWKRANMRWEGETVLGVGVKRSGKGTLSMDTPKPSIRISFNEFEFANPAGPGTPGRKWRDVNRIKLDSMVGNTDPAMMRDRVAYGIFRAAGAPAPRACHGRLYVNNVFKGLYTVEEPVRKDFVRYRWGEDTGNLYNQDGWGTDAYDWRGTSPSSYVPDPFNAETNYPGGDYTDLVTLMDHVNNGGSQIRTRLDGHINLDGFLRHLAMTVVIADMDEISHVGGGWCNNHLWYHRAGTNKMEIIKWDPGAAQGLYDASFGFAKGEYDIGYNYETVKMTSWVKNDSVAWGTVKTKILQILDGPVAGIQARIDSIYNQIKSHAYADTLKGINDGDPNGFSNAEFDAAVVWLKDWYVKRDAYLRSQIGAPALTNNAQFVSQNVPASMVAGQTYSVSVTMRNSGTTTWTDAGGYSLTSKNPDYNTTWGLYRVYLAAGDSIAPNASKTFTWTVTAPSTAGTYAFQWQMRQSGVEWFGPLTPNVAVTVTTTAPPPPPPTPSGNGAQFVSQNVPVAMQPGQTYTVSVTMRNTGTTTWIDDPTNPYRLGSQNPQDNMTWGMNRVSLPPGASIAPGQDGTYTWDVTAPSTAGTYAFQWQMRQSGVEWFGEMTANVPVDVSAAAPPPPPLNTDRASSGGGCGLTGLEGALLALAGLLARRGR
jgi:alkylated DNA repair dioxygenase AlkB